MTAAAIWPDLAHHIALLRAAAELLDGHKWEASTHNAGCWEWHGPCLAAQIRDTLGDRGAQ